MKIRFASRLTRRPRNEHMILNFYKVQFMNEKRITRNRYAGLAVSRGFGAGGVVLRGLTQKMTSASV